MRSYMTAPSLYLALDVPSAAKAEPLVQTLAAEVGGFKLGSELFLAEGPRLADLILGLSAHLFVDLKLHDIPRTVEAGARSLSRLGAHLLTIHASGGADMVKAAVLGASERAQCKVIAVTVLTSHTQQTLESVAVRESIVDHVLRLADLAITAGAHGVVCSVHEAASLRQRFGNDIELVCPGIRPEGVAHQDQKRVATPAEAVIAGASVLVVGRPIIEAQDRKQMTKQVTAQMRSVRFAGATS